MFQSLHRPHQGHDRHLPQEREDHKRLYLIKEMAHAPFDPPGPTEELWANSVRTLHAWVAAGVELGPIDAGALGSHPSCEARGHGTDPLGCFADVFGTGF